MQLDRKREGGGNETSDEESDEDEEDVEDEEEEEDEEEAGRSKRPKRSKERVNYDEGGEEQEDEVCASLSP